MNYLKQDTLALSPLYVRLLLAFYCIWLVVSLFTKRFHIDAYNSYRTVIILHTKAVIYMVYCLAVMIVVMDLQGFSRLQISGTCGLFYVGEILIVSIYYASIDKLLIFNTGRDKGNIESEPQSKFLYTLVVSDFLLVTALFFALHYLYRGTFVLSIEYEKLLVIIYGLWFVSAMMARKFHSHYRNYYYAIAQCMKAIVFMAATIAVIICAFRLYYYSRSELFVFFAALILSESVLYFIYFAAFRNGESNGDIESSDEIRTIARQEELDHTLDIEELHRRLTEQIRTKLQKIFFADSPEVFNFLDSTLDLLSIIRAETALIERTEAFQQKTLDPPRLRLLINLEHVNNLRWVNRFFLEVYKILIPNGYFVSSVNTISLYRKRFFQKYPPYFAQIFYFFNFIFRRVFPKLSVTKKIYFSITKGKNRAISKAETLGRLYFCGFKVIAEKEIGDYLYFVAQKDKTISIDENPSYGPFVKFQRVGQFGHIIDTYKFRTMHPYSEYLQEYIYENNQLQPGGKFFNDFRVTTIGRFMRQLWLDEIPMLYNWFKGELNLVGVRPLSIQYFNLYPPDLQKKRMSVPPGLIPPFYADLPETFDEICDSERKYINAYLKHPLRTKWVYFWKAMMNIFFKGARSN